MILNPFNQYDRDENRLTHALAITLERSAIFRAAFIESCGATKLLGKAVRVEIQVVMHADGTEEETAIPDLMLVDENDRGVIFEVKVGASLDRAQLQRHEARAREYGVKVIGEYALTGRAADREKMAQWQNGFINKRWLHIAWTSVFEVADRLKNRDEWARDLADYLGIVAERMGDDDMDSKVKLTTFTGIPFMPAHGRKTVNTSQLYDARQAKRHLLALMDCLENDDALLKTLGFAAGQKPRRRGSIDISDSVWDFLSPLGEDDNFTSSHHFTIGIASDAAHAMLTIPNASKEARQLRQYAKHHDADAFSTVLKGFMKEVERRKLNAHGFQPCIVMKQRRYKNMKLYAVDGSLTFDLRTLSGAPAANQVPAIPEQPEWASFCHQLLRDKNSNIQLQIGLHFLYGHTEKLDRPEAVNFFKEALCATTAFLKAIQ